MTIRVLIVDDSALMRALLQHRLEREADIAIVGTAANAAEARQLIKALDPDVVTVLPADSAPTGLAAVGDRLYVCGYNTARLDRYIVDPETGIAARAGTIAEGCRLDVIVTAEGSLVFAADDRIVELDDPR